MTFNRLSDLGSGYTTNNIKVAVCHLPMDLWMYNDLWIHQSNEISNCGNNLLKNKAVTSAPLYLMFFLFKRVSHLFKSTRQDILYFQKCLCI